MSKRPLVNYEFDDCVVTTTTGSEKEIPKGI